MIMQRGGPVQQENALHGFVEQSESHLIYAQVAIDLRLPAHRIRSDGVDAFLDLKRREMYFSELVRTMLIINTHQLHAHGMAIMKYCVIHNVQYSLYIGALAHQSFAHTRTRTRGMYIHALKL